MVAKGIMNNARDFSRYMFEQPLATKEAWSLEFPNIDHTLVTECVYYDG